MANISKIKRDKMIAFLEDLKKAHTDDESIRAFNEIENSLLEKKYGLVFEEHTEEVDERLKIKFRYSAKTKNAVFVKTKICLGILLSKVTICKHFICLKRRIKAELIVFISIRPIIRAPKIGSITTTM